MEWKCQLSIGMAEVHHFTIPMTRDSDQLRTSQVWICDSCGKCYAKLHLWHFFSGRKLPYLALRGRCDLCPPDYWCLPGSILMSWDSEFFNALPVAVLNREFLIRTEHLIKEGKLNEPDALW